MQPRTLIAIDAGTTGVTCLLFDTKLRVLGRAYREFEQVFPEPGWVEHRTSDLLGAVDVVLAEILALPEARGASAIGITNQRETIFAVQRGSHPVRTFGNGIVWQDRRTADHCKRLEAGGHEDLVRARTGLVLDPYFSATKMAWLLEHHADLPRLADAGDLCFLTVDALIVQHLTRGAACATDPTNASRTSLYDIEKRCWDEELCELFAVPIDALPDVQPSTSRFGVTAESVCGRAIEIHGIAGDQQAALFGQGCVHEGELKNTYGTGCFLLLNTGERRVQSERGLLTTLAVDAKGEPCFALEGSVFAGGLIVQWMRDQMGFLAEASDSEEIARTVPDCGGVTLVPAFAGLGAPYWDPGARAAIVGLTRGSSRAHIVRAGLEAIAFQSAELVELFRAETGLEIDELLVDGGAARNTLLMQMQADFAGVEVIRRTEVEATACGAAALAGLGSGLIERPLPGPDSQFAGDRLVPTLGAEERARRLEAWRAAVARVRS